MSLSDPDLEGLNSPDNIGGATYDNSTATVSQHNMMIVDIKRLWSARTVF
jgi:hypothetical protein